MKFVKGFVGWLVVCVLAALVNNWLAAAVPPDRIPTLQPLEQLGWLLAALVSCAVFLGSLFVLIVGTVAVVHQYATAGKRG